MSDWMRDFSSKLAERNERGAGLSVAVSALIVALRSKNLISEAEEKFINDIWDESDKKFTGDL